MPVITAKFTANVDDFRTQLQAATTEVTGFSRTTTQVNNELRKFGNEFSGAQIIRQAETAAKAIDELGGASALNSREIAKLGPVAVEAMQKLQALGQQASPELQKLTAEIKRVQEAEQQAAQQAKAMADAQKGSVSSDLLGALGELGPAITGAFSIGAVVAFGKSLVDMASQIHDVAEQTGLSTDAVQEFKYAATQTGTSFETVTKSVDKLSKNLEDGSKQTRDAVTALGLSFNTLQQSSPEDAFTAIAEAIRQVPDPMKQTQLAMELFGKAGAQILPAIKEGFKDLRNEAHQFGQVLDKEAINALEAFGDKWGRLMTSIKVTGAESVLAVSKAFESLPNFAQVALGYIQGGAAGAASAATVMSIADRNRGHTEDIPLTTLAQTGTAKLTEQLQAARNAIAQFTPEMRAAAAAGEVMGLSNDKIAQSVSKVKDGFEVSTETIDLFVKQTKEAIKLSPEKAFTEAAQKAQELAVFIQKAGGATAFSRDQQDEFNKELFKGVEAYQALKKTGDPSYDLILKQAFATANWSKELGPVKKGIDDVIKSLNALPDASAKTDIIIGGYAKLAQTAEQTAESLKGIGVPIATAGQAFETSLKRTAEAYHSFGLVSQQELQRAAIASAQNYQILLNSGTATTAQLRIAYQQMIEAQIIATGKLPTLWQMIAHDIPALFGTIANSFADNVGKMLSGQESFKDGFLGIWRDIQRELGNIFADIVSQFERTFIANITSSLLGSGGVWGGIISTALHAGTANAAVGGGGVSGIGTTIASADQAYRLTGAGGSAGTGLLSAGSGGATLAGHTASWGTIGSYAAGPAAGALVGGVVGWKVGRATGNWAEGAAAGAGAGAATGAAVGSVVPGFGTALGAGVGAIVGGIAGIWGAHKANEDARNQMVEVRSELEKTFGSLDNVRKNAQMVGVDIDKAFANIGRGVKGTKEFNEVVGEFETKWNALDGAMKRYGITMDDLNKAQKTPQQLFTDQVNQLQSDFTALTGTGASLGKDTVITKMAGSFNDLLVAAQESGNKIPQALVPILDRMAELGLITDDTKAKLLGLSDGTNVDFQKMESIAQNYGISLAALGPQFQQAKLSASAKQIFDDFTMLQGAGADVGGVLAGMSDEISTLVQNSQKFGTEIPDNMRPLIENLINSGELLDENGQKITDIGTIKFAAPVEEGFDKIVDAIDRLSDKLTTGLPSAVDDATSALDRMPKNLNFDVNVNRHYQDDGTDTGAPATALGGIVWSPQTRLVGEAGPEVISPLSELPRLLGPPQTAGQPIVIHHTTMLDNRVVARSVQKVWASELRLHGAAR